MIRLSGAEWLQKMADGRRLSVSERRKRRETLITAFLIAGMCIVVAGTIIFVAKFNNREEASETGASSGITLTFADESIDVTTTSEFTTTLAVTTTEAASSSSTAESTTGTTTESATESPKDAVTPTPSESSETSETSEETVPEDMGFAFSSEPDMLTSIKELKAGTIVSKEEIDMKNLSQYFTSVKIEEGDSIYQRINGKSYQKNNDIKLSDLRYLKMLHVNFNGDYQVGEMIVNKSISDEVLGIFKSLFQDGYQIYSMYLIDNFWEKNAGTADWNSIEANNTSCFCYRAATGGSKLSKHALGRAIDINPQQNPYVTYKDGKASCAHSNAADYVSNRSSKKAHVITTSDKAYKAFTKKGWTWGGSWSSPKDYQHFQK